MQLAGRQRVSTMTGIALSLARLLARDSPLVTPRSPTPLHLPLMTDATRAAAAAERLAYAVGFVIAADAVSGLAEVSIVPRLQKPDEEHDAAERLEEYVAAIRATARVFVTYQHADVIRARRCDSYPNLLSS